MEIALYGGSFNPGHNGHMEPAVSILGKDIVDEIWMSPCKTHAFHKSLISLDDRINMINLAIGSLPSPYSKRIKIDYTEVSIEGINYTADTLKILRAKNPDKNFCLILGADAFNDISKWGNFDYIAQTTAVIVINREGYTLNRNTGVKIKAVIKKVANISSTDIRERLSAGESIHGMVPDSVEQYILKNGLYKDTKFYNNPASTADLIVNTDEGMLYVKRKHAPFKGCWALPGGYLNCGKETLEGAGVRELLEETSIKTNVNDLKLLGVYSDPQRDPRGHVISHAYFVTQGSGIPDAADDAAELRFFKNKPDVLAFDHSKIVDDFYKIFGKDAKTIMR